MQSQFHPVWFSGVTIFEGVHKNNTVKHALYGLQWDVMLFKHLWRILVEESNALMRKYSRNGGKQSVQWDL